MKREDFQRPSRQSSQLNVLCPDMINKLVPSKFLPLLKIRQMQAIALRIALHGMPFMDGKFIKEAVFFNYYY